MTTRPLLVAALSAALAASGCSMLSESITSPSESITGTGRAIAGVFTSISRSSGVGASGQPWNPAYVRDLRQYVAAFVAAGDGTTAEFQRGVSRIAEGHGIGHWEAEPATSWAIGQGMREAHVGEAEMRAFCAAIGSDSPAAELALEGWRAAGS